MNVSTKIRADYSSDIAKFIKNGGVIKKAVNTNKCEFNHFNADMAAQNAEKPNSYQNAVLRKRAENKEKKSYVPVAPCRSCLTSERSVKSNACLECDRRRFRAKTQFNETKLSQIFEYLYQTKQSFLFKKDGKTFILKIEEQGEPSQ